jgi:hypothetical protein
MLVWVQMLFVSLDLESGSRKVKTPNPDQGSVFNIPDNFTKSFFINSVDPD